MSDDYTPTTEQVRNLWGSEGNYLPAAMAETIDGRYAEFDRWHDAEKAKWQAEALRDAAAELPRTDGGPAWRGWLLDTADIVERGE